MFNVDHSAVAMQTAMTCGCHGYRHASGTRVRSPTARCGRREMSSGACWTLLTRPSVSVICLSETALDDDVDRIVA